MPASGRIFLIGAGSLLLLYGCGSGSYSSSRGTISSTSVAGNTVASAPRDPLTGGGGPTGAHDSVVATASVAGTLSVAVGAQQTLSITFTSSDGSPISGFGVSGNLDALPAGWSGPKSFSCASVDAGSGCVLNLVYAPPAAASGMLTIDYVFVNNAAMPDTSGSLTIAYAATPQDNVVAAASPTGEINAQAGAGDQSVSVSFTTDDGNAATNLTLTTDLSALPAGWSSAAAGFSCAIVSAGSGCQLPLTFAPAASTRGLLTLSYGYTDNSGTARSGAINIPYSTSTHNTVIATASPAGEINAVEKTGTQPVTVTFTTDDGKAASAVYVTSSLSALPPGWTSVAHGFACAGVSSGNGCQLHLSYSPPALTGGTLIVDYAYTDGAGAPQSGSLNLAYAATTDDNAIATASPSGQISVVAPSGGQPVSVTFTTDDGRPATALRVTSNLSALPAGWSSTAASFSCSGFSGGNGCQLPLMYAPSTADSGTLIVGYAYINNAGKPKSGSVNIAYRATTDDSIIGAWSPNPVSVTTGSTTPVNVTFATDDSNPASGFSITSGLGTLPTGWSSTSGTFTCATVSATTLCQLGLTYAAPMTAQSGTVSLNFAYNDNSGTAKTGSVSIPYTAGP